jgi:hypothetical protein
MVCPFKEVLGCQYADTPVLGYTVSYCATEMKQILIICMNIAKVLILFLTDYYCAV